MQLIQKVSRSVFYINKPLFVKNELVIQWSCFRVVLKNYVIINKKIPKITYKQGFKGDYPKVCINHFCHSLASPTLYSVRLRPVEGGAVAVCHLPYLLNPSAQATTALAAR